MLLIQLFTWSLSAFDKHPWSTRLTRLGGYLTSLLVLVACYPTTAAICIIGLDISTTSMVSWGLEVIIIVRITIVSHLSHWSWVIPNKRCARTRWMSWKELKSTWCLHYQKTWSHKGNAMLYRQHLNGKSNGRKLRRGQRLKRVDDMNFCGLSRVPCRSYRQFSYHLILHQRS